MNIKQEQYVSKTKGNTYIFQSPSSNLKTLEILDLLEVTGGGSPVMHKSFPTVLEEVVIKPQDLTVDSEEFQGVDGIQELIEVCSQAVRFLSAPNGMGKDATSQIIESDSTVD